MSKISGEIFSWIKTIVFAFILAMAINNYVIVNATVPTGSMENTIMTDDRIVAFRMSYLFAEPQRGDIIVFQYPDNEEILYVKRLIGLPGETIEIKGGKVYINGADLPLDEPYLKEEPYDASFGPYTVPEDHYFMMGDNRNNSLDSRYWTNKYVSKEKIEGKVFFRYYPGFKFF